MSSFVAKKSNKQWICIALDAKTRQVIVFHVGDRNKESARQLWEKIPEVYRQHTTFYTDLYDSYLDVIPEKQRIRVTKNIGLAETHRTLQLHNAAEDFTAGQRLLGLVEKLDNHIGAIRYFICRYNQIRNPAALLMYHYQMVINVADSY